MEVKAKDRRVQISELVNEGKAVSVSDLSNMFSLSPVTIRNDLRKLKTEGSIQRTYGGAVGTKNVAFEFSFQEKSDRFFEEKRRIGEFAASLVEEGQTILLDGGTTCLQIAKNIKNVKNLTVVTNGLCAVSELRFSKNIELIILGGIYRPVSLDIVGPFVIERLSKLSVDKSFCGTDGLTLSRGLTSPDPLEAEVQHAMMSCSKEVIVVTDHSKIGKDSFVSFASMSEIEKLITDNGLPGESKKLLEKNGVEVITV